MAARSTHCAAGAPLALACGGEDWDVGEGWGAGIAAPPGSQTGSTGGAKAAADEVTAGAGGGELPALREECRAEAAACVSRATLAGPVLGSGFMMLIAGMDAALGKSMSTSAFFWLWPGDGWLAASAASEGGSDCAIGVSPGCPHSAE